MRAIYCPDWFFWEKTAKQFVICGRPSILIFMELALYRKHRPSTFGEVLGQDDIVNILLRSVEKKSISHAYLFSGGRGTGKTSVARIFATAIGCKPADLYEIDGASNRKIEDIRELREAVRSMPFESPYKVYIIDEVHMLTRDAWNALLKTLEEPPEHVVFILATTNKDAVPDTILSRCQTFTFRAPGLEELKKFVLDMAKKEMLKLAPQSADIIALFGDGSYRDTLSVLEKVLVASKGGELSVDDVARIVGAPTHDLVHRVLRAVATEEAGEGLKAIRTAHKDHVSMPIYLKLIIERMRAVLLLRYDASSDAEMLDAYGSTELATLKEFATASDKKINSHVLSIFLEATETIGHSVVPPLPIELALIRAVEGK